MAAIIKELRNLLELLLTSFGSVGTVIVTLIFCGVMFGWRIYRDKKREKWFDRVLEEKERALQRAVNEAREYRIHFFRQKGWSEQDIEKFIVKNEFDSGPSARKHLEGGNYD